SIRFIDQIFQHRLVCFQSQIADRVYQRVPSIVNVFLECIAVSQNFFRFCKSFCKFCLSCFHIFCQVNTVSQFNCHFQICLVSWFHIQSVDRAHQLDSCICHFFSCGIFICHHCFAFCNRFCEKLPDRFYTVVNRSVLYIAFCFVEEVL